MSRDMDLLRSLEGGMPLGVPVTTNHEIRQEVCFACTVLPMIPHI